MKENPDIVIGTPGKIFAHLQSKSFTLKESLEIVVFDEADLLFSFGYEKEVQNIKNFLPEVCQVLLTSATLSEEIVKMKKLFLHNPVSEGVLFIDDEFTAGACSTDASKCSRCSKYRCEEMDGAVEKIHCVPYN